MIENLVIVESPAKAKTIEKFLGKAYTVKSSFGHIRDLAKKNLGIDIEKGFTPKYVIPADKKKIAVTVQPTQVAGMQPAVNNGFSGSLGTTPVLLHIVSTTNHDLTGFALGGNKVRKLEYILGNALAKKVGSPGCDRRHRFRPNDP